MHTLKHISVGVCSAGSPCHGTLQGCGTWSHGNSLFALYPVERIFIKMKNITNRHKGKEEREKTKRRFTAGFQIVKRIVYIV